MERSRRQLLKGLLGLPFVTQNILYASAQPKHGPASKSQTGSRAKKTTLGSICVHFEGAFAYWVYSDRIDVFTPNLPTEHDYCMGLGEQRLYAYPQMDIDLRQALPDIKGSFRLSDKTRNIIFNKSEIGVTAPDFNNRYWRITVPIPSDITSEGESSQVKEPFEGKHSSLANQLTQIQTSYKFSYDVDQATAEKLHLRLPASNCALDLRYCVSPKNDTYAHAVKAFHSLRLMLPNLDLDLKPDIGHATLTAQKMHALDTYVLDGHIVLCSAPSVFVIGP